MKVLIVGSNPSTSSSTNSPFCVSTKSGIILQEWMESVSDIPGIEFELANVSCKKTENNRPLRVSEIREALPDLMARIGEIGPDKVVALGKTASKALKQCQMEFFEMNHPSGLNRLNNDPQYVAQKLKELREFIESP